MDSQWRTSFKTDDIEFNDINEKDNIILIINYSLNEINEFKEDLK